MVLAISNACSKCGAFFKRSDTFEHTCVVCGKTTYFGNPYRSEISSFVKSASKASEPASGNEDELTKVLRQQRKDRKKELILKDIADGVRYDEISKKHKISSTTIRNYASDANLNDLVGFRQKGKFTRDIKMVAVNDYIDTGDSRKTVAKRNEVSRMALSNWINEYNEHQGKGWY
jgi:transposase-like protein|tara:strand:- start:1675 stop:2199 length:525 start_codon:yes stop_codon:yes gene_type:complete